MQESFHLVMNEHCTHDLWVLVRKCKVLLHLVLLCK